MIAARSALFAIWFFGTSLLLHLIALPVLVLPRRFAVGAAKLWANNGLFGLRLFTGIRYEVRGAEHIPSDAALIASKHQSTWETLALTAFLKDPAIVLKRELLWIPVFGWFLTKLGMIPIDRDKGTTAIRRMRLAAARAATEQRQIVIFPEGTRRKPGAPTHYKPGTAALYAQLNVPCVPVALNSGLHWRRFWKIPGVIVIEFLPPIPPGLSRAAFMNRLETAIETNSLRLT